MITGEGLSGGASIRLLIEGKRKISSSEEISEPFGSSVRPVLVKELGDGLYVFGYR